MSDLPTTDDARPAAPPFLALLEARAWIVILVIVVVGFVLRLEKLDWWINPDEGIYRSIVTQPTFGAAWRELSSNAHPPLYSAMLWTMTKVSDATAWMRLISLVSGCAAIVGVWLLARELVGVIGGLVAAFVVAVSPAAIEQSQIMRPYMLQLAFLSFGLAGLAMWYRRRTRGLVLFSVCMSLAVLTHYGTYPIVGVVLLLLGVAAALRQFDRSELVRLAWALAPVLIVMIVLYFAHVRPNMVGSSMQKMAKATWLERFFVQDAGQAWWATLGLMRYLFGTSMAAPAIAVLLTGVVWGVARAQVAAFLVFTVLVVAVLGSAAGIYPFGGSRHSVYLVTFVAIGVGLAVQLLVETGGKTAIASGLGLACLLVARAPINTALGADNGALLLPDGELEIPRDECDALLPALYRVRDSEGLVVMSMQTYYCLHPLLGRYMNKPASQGKLFYQFRWGKRTVIVAGTWNQTLSDSPDDPVGNINTFLREVASERPALRLLERDRLWMPFAGWDNRLLRELRFVNAKHVPGLLIHDEGDKATDELALLELDLRRLWRLYERRK